MNDVHGQKFYKLTAIFDKFWPHTRDFSRELGQRS